VDTTPDNSVDMATGEAPAVVLLPVPEKVPTGLGVIRSLGRAGVPVIAASPESAPLSFLSRYVTRRLRSPKLEDGTDRYVDWLAHVGEGLCSQAVLFPTTDEQVVAVNEHAETLSRFLRYPYLSSAALEGCIRKSRSLEIASAAGLATPRSLLVTGADAVSDIVDEIGLPCVVKPDSWVYNSDGHVARNRALRRALGQKVVRVETVDGLRQLLTRLEGVQGEVVVQEEVSGSADSIFICLIYAPQPGRSHVAYCGRKTRQFPSDFGTCTLAQAAWNIAAADAATK